MLFGRKRFRGESPDPWSNLPKTTLNLDNLIAYGKVEITTIYPKDKQNPYPRTVKSSKQVVFERNSERVVGDPGNGNGLSWALLNLQTKMEIYKSIENGYESGVFTESDVEINWLLE